MKKYLALTFMLLLCLSLVACSGGDQDSSNDKTALYMVCAKQAVENYLSDVSYSNDTDDWTITEMDDGTTSIVTKATMPNDPEKKLVNVIIKLVDNDSQDGKTKFESYFVEVGGSVYLDALPEGA